MTIIGWKIERSGAGEVYGRTWGPLGSQVTALGYGIFLELVVDLGWGGSLRCVLAWNLFKFKRRRGKSWGVEGVSDG